MYREAMYDPFQRDEIEVLGTRCPRCGKLLECDRCYEYLMLSCPHCGYCTREQRGNRSWAAYR